MDKYAEMYMRIAIEAARFSKAIRKKVGCVIVTKDLGLAIGLNGTPPNWPYGNGCEAHDGKGNLVTLPEVRHAERAALIKAHDNKMDTRGSVAYITTEPCFHCAERLYDAGVASVYYLESYRTHDGIIYLTDVGIHHEQMKSSELLDIFLSLQVEQTENKRTKPEDYHYEAI